MTSYRIKPETDEKIENIFTHHPPFGNQLARFKHIRDEAKALAFLIVSASSEQDQALVHLQEVAFWANAAISRHEKPEPEKLGPFAGSFAGCYGGHDPNELPDDSEESGGDPVPRDERPTGNVIPC